MLLSPSLTHAYKKFTSSFVLTFFQGALLAQFASHDFDSITETSLPHVRTDPPPPLYVLRSAF